MLQDLVLVENLFYIFYQHFLYIKRLPTGIVKSIKTYELSVELIYHPKCMEK